MSQVRRSGLTDDIDERQDPLDDGGLVVASPVLRDAERNGERQLAYDEDGFETEGQKQDAMLVVRRNPVLVVMPPVQQTEDTVLYADTDGADNITAAATKEGEVSVDVQPFK